MIYNKLVYLSFFSVNLILHWPSSMYQMHSLLSLQFDLPTQMFEWLWERLRSIKRGLMQCGRWIRDKYRRHPIKCKVILISLAALILLTGLIVGSYKSVSSTNQGVAINYTSGTLEDDRIANEGFFLGLNTYYHSLPNTYFTVAFDSDAPSSSNTYPSIIARVQQGIRLRVEAHARVRVQTNELSAFMQNYGINTDGGREGWQWYIAQKIRNVVVQQIATHKLYSISNSVVTTAVNSQLASYTADSTLGFPYNAKVISLNMHYPNATPNNKTLGVKLLQASSLLSQLNTQKTLIDSYVSQYQSSAQGYARQGGQLMGRMKSAEWGVKISSPEWVQAIQLYNQTVQNQTLLQKYLQIYFNKVYNATYRIQSLTPFQI